MKTHDNLAAFTRAYAHAMLWANTHNDDDHDTPVDPFAWLTNDPDWALGAFDDESRASIEEDCAAFFAANLRDLIAYAREYDYASAGHDFALTRSHHGAGFWDRGLGVLGDRLTASAHPFGEVDAWTVEGDEFVHLF